MRGQAQYSWAHLLLTSATVSAAPQPCLSGPSTAVSSTDQDARALAFFRAHVAPALSRHSSAPFWTVRVAQVAAAEPAVHHALVAISALYEGRERERGPTGPAVTAAKGARERFAITRYNRALGHLQPLAPQAMNTNIVLLVCLLFICIEAIMGDKDTAIAHCRHGILICNAMPEGGLRGWAREELRPMFLRLATFPYFFGMEAGEFPAPGGLVAAAAARDGGDDAGFDVSSTAWDALVNQAVRVVRQGLSHRQGPLRDLPVPETLVQTQRHTLASLGAWREHFRSQRSGVTLADEDLETHLYREMEAIAGLIWVACCLDASEMGYDAYLGDFTDLLALSQQLIDQRPAECEPRPIFSFEMGFTPFLYFVVLKCRRLELRVRALRHILHLGYDQENLFHTRMLYSVGLKLVEREHGIELNPAWPEIDCAGAADALMPGDEKRVRTTNITEEKEVRVGEGARLDEYTKVYFVLRPEAVVPGHMEWVNAQPLSSRRPERPGSGGMNMVGRERRS